MLVLTLLLGVATPLAGAISQVEMDSAAELTLGSHMYVNVSNAGSYAYLIYTPQATCNYVLYSTGNTDTEAYLYDHSGDELASDDNSGDNNNFRLEFTLTAGETYYFGVGFVGGNTMGAIYVNFEQLHDWSEWVSDNSSTTVLPEGATFESVTLSLKSETTLSLYFKSDKELTFSCEGMTVEKANVGEYQVARIRGISAEDLYNDFTLTVSDGTTNGSVTYSPMTYCYNVLDRSEDEALRNVVTALCWYCMFTYYYFNGYNE